MAKQGDNLFKRTGKKLSVLVFETTKHSRIMKKRMRIGMLQKEVKADYRDLGRLVYDAVLKGREADLFADEEMKILLANLEKHNHEMERLREGIARIARTKKYFDDAVKGGKTSSDESSNETPAKPKRSFLGLKKQKAAEELLKKAVDEFGGGAPAAKPKRSFLGLGKKKAAAQKVAAEGSDTPKAAEAKTEPPKVEKKRSFLGLGKKKTPSPSAEASETPKPKKPFLRGKSKAEKPSKKK